MPHLRSISFHVLSLTCLVAAGILAASTPSFAAEHPHTSGPFMGVKANTGSVTHVRQGNQQILTLSDDFKVPDAPAPHWQVADSRGNTYLLQRLVVKGDRFNKQIVLPPYIRDVAKVQIWCAWAEVLLGEATFGSPVK
jgi:hypothetical protein